METLAVITQLEAGLASFQPQQRRLVVYYLRGLVEPPNKSGGSLIADRVPSIPFPSSLEIAYCEREGLTDRNARLYQNVAIDFAQAIDPKFNEAQMGDQSDAAVAYRNLYSMIEGTSKEDIIRFVTNH